MVLGDAFDEGGDGCAVCYVCGDEADVSRRVYSFDFRGDGFELGYGAGAEDEGLVSGISQRCFTKTKVLEVESRFGLGFLEYK